MRNWSKGGRVGPVAKGGYRSAGASKNQAGSESSGKKGKKTETLEGFSCEQGPMRKSSKRGWKGGRTGDPGAIDVSD